MKYVSEISGKAAPWVAAGMFVYGCSVFGPAKMFSSDRDYKLENKNDIYDLETVAGLYSGQMHIIEQTNNKTVYHGQIRKGSPEFRKALGKAMSDADHMGVRDFWLSHKEIKDLTRKIENDNRKSGRYNPGKRHRN